MSDGTDLGRLFAGVVVPEATPSPRTIRFATPSLGDGPSRSFDAVTADDDPWVARIFRVSDEVTNVLVGPTFVAVTILHAHRWESLLPPLLQVVTDGFTDADEPTGSGAGPPVVLTLDVGGTPADVAEPRRLERAWTEFGMLRGTDGEGLDRIVGRFTRHRAGATAGRRGVACRRRTCRCRSTLGAIARRPEPVGPPRRRRLGQRRPSTRAATAPRAGVRRPRRVDPLAGPAAASLRSGSRRAGPRSKCSRRIPTSACGWSPPVCCRARGSSPGPSRHGGTAATGLDRWTAPA